MFDILPPNSTPLEKNVAVLAQRITAIPVPFAPLFDYVTCPEPFIPWLAWSLNVEYWKPDWSLAKKRTACAESRDFNAQRGTKAALHYALDQLEMPYELKLWHELTPRGQPFTFTVRLPSRPLTIGELEAVTFYIDPAKSARDLYGIEATVISTARVNVAGAVHSGERIFLATQT